MSKRSAKSSAKFNVGAADFATAEGLSLTRCHEFGVESLCELTTEILIAVAACDDDQRLEASAALVRRYWALVIRRSASKRRRACGTWDLFLR
jgi:hypothetical protein